MKYKRGVLQNYLKFIETTVVGSEKYFQQVKAGEGLKQFP